MLAQLHTERQAMGPAWGSKQRKRKRRHHQGGRAPHSHTKDSCRGCAGAGATWVEALLLGFRELGALPCSSLGQWYHQTSGYHRTGGYPPSCRSQIMAMGQIRTHKEDPMLRVGTWILGTCHPPCNLSFSLRPPKLSCHGVSDSWRP